MRTSTNMFSLGVINEFLGMPPNASEHGYQIDHIIEFSHWFMGALFLGWSTYFVFVLIRFRKRRHPKADYQGIKSGISTHLEFSVVLIEAVLLIVQKHDRPVLFYTAVFIKTPSATIKFSLKKWACPGLAARHENPGARAPHS